MMRSLFNCRGAEVLPVGKVFEVSCRLQKHLHPGLFANTVTA